MDGTRIRAASISLVLSLAAITHSSHRWFPRYLVPLYPAIYVLAAGLLVRMADWGHQRWAIRPVYLALGLIVVTIILAAPQLASSLYYDSLMASQP